jgi:hypothetical protein
MRRHPNQTKEIAMVMEPRKRPGPPTSRNPGRLASVRRGGQEAAPTGRKVRLAVVRPLRPAGARRHPLWTLLAAYLAGTFILLAVVFLLPHRSGALPPPRTRTWDYQLETVALQGRGLLNAYARGAVRATAWLARGSIERQRDVHRLNLLEYLAGDPAARALARFVDANRLALQGGTIALLLGVAAYGVLRRPAGREWLVAILMLLALTAVLTRPVTAARLAGQAGVAVPNLVLRAAAEGDATQELRGGSQQVQQALAGRYWVAFVAQPLSRLQTGTGVLSSAPPARKAGIVGYLRGKVRAVNDWAVGRHGAERSVISTLAVIYVLPFALALCALAMLATLGQALLFLLCLAAPVALALTVEPRWRARVLRYWLLPLGAAVALLSGAALASFLVVRVAELLHGSDDYLGLLLAGSAWPTLAIVLLARRWRRHRQLREERRSVVLRGGAA